MRKKSLFIATIFITLASAISCKSEQKNPGVIAHRGYWKTEGSAQNSRASFENAIKAQCEGSEMDVYLTTDNRLILFHDNNIKLNIEGQEVSKRVDSCSYDELQTYRLENGETLPLLEEILEIAKEQDEQWKASEKSRGKDDIYTKAIIEIKSHSTAQRDAEAAIAIHEMVKAYGLENKIEYISFSHNVCDELLKIAKGTPIALLDGNLAPSELKDKGFTGLDYSLSVMREHENWFDEAKSLGLDVNVWTVNTEEDMRYLIAKKIKYITTNEPILLQSIYKEMAQE